MGLSYEFPVTPHMDGPNMHSNAVAHIVTVSDSQKIIVRKPIVDTITLTCSGKAALQSIANSSNDKWDAVGCKYWDGFYKRVIEEIKAPDQVYIQDAKGWIPKYKTNAVLTLPTSGAKIKLSTQSTGKNSALRLEFSPSKFDEKAYNEFCDLWDHIDLGNISLPAMLHDAKVTRLDVAVDVLGIEPKDIFVHREGVWKIWWVSASKSGIEAAQYYIANNTKQGAQLSPKKRANFIVYDKLKEQLANGVKPKFGKQLHSRLEWSTRKNMAFTNLLEMKCPFEGWEARRLLIDEPPVKEEWMWKVIFDSVRFRGWNETIQLLPNDVIDDGAGDQREKFFPNDLVSEELLWKHWEEGVKASHLSEFIKSSAMPPQDNMPFHGVF